MCHWLQCRSYLLKGSGFWVPFHYTPRDPPSLFFTTPGTLSLNYMPKDPPLHFHFVFLWMRWKESLTLSKHNCILHWTENSLPVTSSCDLFTCLKTGPHGAQKDMLTADSPASTSRRLRSQAQIVLLHSLHVVLGTEPTKTFVLGKQSTNYVLRPLCSFIF